MAAGTAVSDELIFVNNELVDPNIVVAFSPAATEFRYFASAPGAADKTWKVVNFEKSKNISR